MVAEIQVVLIEMDMQYEYPMYKAYWSYATGALNPKPTSVYWLTLSIPVIQITKVICSANSFFFFFQKYK